MALPFAIYRRLGVPEEALGEIPLGLGIVEEDKPSELSCKGNGNLKVYFLLSLTRSLIWVDKEC